VGGAEGSFRPESLPVAVDDEGGVATEFEQDHAAAGVRFSSQPTLAEPVKETSFDAIFLFGKPCSVGVWKAEGWKGLPAGQACFQDDFAERQGA